MSRFRLLLRTLWYFRGVNLAVILSVAVGVAALAGSLLVGESVRESLLEIVRSRLGEVDHVLVAPGFFDDRLARRMEAREGFRERFRRAEALLFVRGSCEGQDGAKAYRVNIFGRDSIEPGTCIPNRALADQLAVREGDAVISRLAPLGSSSAGLPVGSDRSKINILRARVGHVAEEGGFEDAFSFYGTQRPPRNLWVSLADLQECVDGSGKRPPRFGAAGPARHGGR